MSGFAPLEIDIHPGVHPTWHFLGMSFNQDTIISTLVAGAIVLILAFVLRASLVKRSGDHVPTKLQILWEGLVGEVTNQVEDNLGKVNAFVVPLAVALFFFILVANWLEMIPSQPRVRQWLPAPTSDTNLTYAMAVLVIVGVWTYGIRQKGVRGYFAHFTQPYPWMLPLNILEELIKPVTLALRLFGNIFAGGIMIALIAGLVQWKIGGFPLGGILSVLANIVWKLFDMVIGVIQAFIFALLTVLYFGMAGAGHSDDETADAHGDEEPHELAA